MTCPYDCGSPYDYIIHVPLSLVTTRKHHLIASFKRPLGRRKEEEERRRMREVWVWRRSKEQVELAVFYVLAPFSIELC